jgi:hypothetical protein
MEWGAPLQQQPRVPACVDSVSIPSFPSISGVTARIQGLDHRVYQSFGGCVPDCACWSCILESKDVIIGYIRALFGVFQTVVVGAVS